MRKATNPVFIDCARKANVLPITGAETYFPDSEQKEILYKKSCIEIDNIKYGIRNIAVGNDKVGQYIDGYVRGFYVKVYPNNPILFCGARGELSTVRKILVHGFIKNYGKDKHGRLVSNMQKTKRSVPSASLTKYVNKYVEAAIDDSFIAKLIDSGFLVTDKKVYVVGNRSVRLKGTQSNVIKKINLLLNSIHVENEKKIDAFFASIESEREVNTVTH